MAHAAALAIHEGIAPLVPSGSSQNSNQVVTVASKGLRHGRFSGTPKLGTTRALGTRPLAMLESRVPVRARRAYILEPGLRGGK